MNTGSRILFEQEPVGKAVMRLAVPTILSQIILVIYNMADTFFIGMADSDIKLSAVTLCTPAFLLLTAIANLFGVGGAAAISRANGEGKTETAGEASGFSFYGCIAATALYSFLMWSLMDVFVNLLGAIDPDIHYEAVSYILITVVFGGIFTALNSLLSHLVRAEGRSFAAGFGIMFGSLLNIFLDPLFMFVLMKNGSEVRAVAAATAVSNLAASGYFMILLLRIRKRGSTLRFRLSARPLRDGTAREILTTGLPACLMTLMENISYAVLGHLMAAAGAAYQAAIGVAKKVNMLAHSMTRGMTQGVLPLIAYNYSAKNYRRMKKTILVSSLSSVLLAGFYMGVCLLFGKQLVMIFIDGGPSLYYGTSFLKVLCIGGPFSAFAYAVISFLQAVKENRRSFGLAMLRKGIIDIPMMAVLFSLSGAASIVWATPVTDMISCAAAAMLFVLALRKIKKTDSAMLTGGTDNA